MNSELNATNTRSNRSGRQVVDHVAVDDAHQLVDVGGAQPVEHRLADVDPRDVVAEAGEWDRQPAGADGELEDPSGSPDDERVEERDVGAHVADVGEQLVVDVGDPLAVRLWSVPLHRDSATTIRGVPMPAQRGDPPL